MVHTSILDVSCHSASGSGSESEGESIATSSERQAMVCLSTHVVKPGAPLAPVSADSLSKKALNHLNL